MEAQLPFYLALSLFANVFFFGAVFFQHIHIENECRHNRDLRNEVTYWKAKLKRESGRV